jgi:uncharacterized protein (TIGR03086 family)
VDDLSELDRASLDWAASTLAGVGPADLDRPTPCGDWTLSQLIGHMVATNDGFALSLAGTPPRGEVWDLLDYAGDPAVAFAASSTRVTDAFRAAAGPERIEVWPYGPIPLRAVFGMHIVDMVVHGWDIATALGRPERPDPGLASAAYAIMLRFPDEPRPSRAFGAKVPVADDADDLDKLLGYLGRTP